MSRKPFNPSATSPTRFAKTQLRKLDPADLRDWLARLRLTPPLLAACLGRSEAVVYMWLAGEHVIPPYVTAWLELASAFDKLCRQYVPREEILGDILKWMEQQPDQDIADDAIARRMALPVGVVREAVEQLRAEGVLS
ncbi:MAG: hypothetical protein WA210_00885 [Burkholderiaceae bacterium]